MTGSLHMRNICAYAILLVLTVAVSPCHSSAADAKPPERVVFIGNSITDGHTYPLLVEQSLHAAGQTQFVAINAGVASDTAADMRKRIERDVLVHHPTLATLSVGVNDSMRG